MWTCPKCGEVIEEQFDSCWKCAGDPPQTVLPSDKHCSVSAVPYAMFVPVLVVMVQSAWTVQGWSFRDTLLANVFLHPVILGGMAIIALLSFFVIRPFASRPTSRWVAFLGCVLGFTFLVDSLLPKLAE